MKTEKIKQLVIEEFGISESNLTSKKRYRNFINARKAFTYLSRKNNDLRFQHLGILLNVHHATAIHYLKCAYNHMDNDTSFRNKINRIQTLINKDLFGEDRKENKDKVKKEFFSSVDWSGVVKELKQVYER